MVNLTDYEHDLIDYIVEREAYYSVIDPSPRDKGVRFHKDQDVHEWECILSMAQKGYAVYSLINDGNTMIVYLTHKVWE